MRTIGAYTNGKWADVFPSEDEDDSTPGCEEQLRQTLTEFLRSQNLIVLTGLGTSLCIKDEGGDQPAPTMWHLWNGIEQEVSTEKLEWVCERVGQPVEDDDEGNETYKQDIELLLSKCLLSQEFRPHKNVAAFIRKAERVISELCDFVTDDLSLDVHEAFLRRIARRPTRHPRAKLFTTNYDLAFETAASRIHFIGVDGFSHTLPQEFDSSYFAYDLVRRDEDGSSPDYIPNVFHLYKVHGSIDWENVAGRIVKSQSTEKPVLIYPRHSKFELSYESPFLDLISRFQSALRQTETSLLVVGFGFNDKHLTQPILSAIRSNVGLRIIVVSPSLETDGGEAIDSMQELVEAGDSRISLVAGKFEQFVPLIPDLISETEEERHRRRMRGDA
ncbi:MAG: SIR2 family protein [Planctomycetaceae bacterium]|nr:SIR2 family protein [Planctomycetaceae bacterium]